MAKHHEHVKPRVVHAFDSLAGEYDQSFSQSPLARSLRRRVWWHLEECFPDGSRIVDLGCGTGEDALWMAHRGRQVLGVDVSSLMLEEARRKAARSEVSDRITFKQVDLGDAPEALRSTLGQGEELDGAYSNFGALNCLAERRSLARVLANCVRLQGRLVLVLMATICPIEILSHLARGRLKTAFRRFRDGQEVRLEGRSEVVRVFYPSPRRLRQELHPWFRPLSLNGLGVVLPPTYLAHLVDERPRLLATLERWDSRFGSRFPGTWFCDHYVATFERSDED